MCCTKLHLDSTYGCKFELETVERETERERERKGITNNILYLFGEYATKEQLFNEMKRKRVHECYKRQWFGLACVDFISH